MKSVLDKPTNASVALIWDKEQLVFCKCGHFLVNLGVTHNWYWQTHNAKVCTLELPDLVCWCGLKRSEHIDGHQR
jgi:hypothetical protein